MGKGCLVLDACTSGLSLHVARAIMALDGVASSKEALSRLF